MSAYGDAGCRLSVWRLLHTILIRQHALAHSREEDAVVHVSRNSLLSGNNEHTYRRSSTNHRAARRTAALECILRSPRNTVIGAI